jgi:WD40-like Beta Propeller Repeat
VKVSQRVDPVGGDSTTPAVSQSALLVAFASRAINLVIGDTNDARDIFVRHRNNGSITRVTVSSSGVEANADSELPSIDSTGAYVVYGSFASNLVPGDTNSVRDVFLHHTPSATTTRISRSSGGVQGNGTSSDPAISGNGRYIAFTSTATNLVSGDTNNANDIFVGDRLTGAVSRVSVRTDGGQGNDGSFHPAISFDGRYVAFSSRATNLVSSDTNGAQDVFVYDRQSATITRVSVRSNGGQADGDSVDPSFARRGNAYVVGFNSTATNLVGNDTNGVGDVYVYTSQPRLTVRASVSGTGDQGNGSSSRATVSDASITTGSQYVAFTSQANNLVPGDTNNESDIIRFDLATGQTCRFSVATGGDQGTTGPNGASQPAIDRAGHRITYTADFANLVPGDGLLTSNVFQTVDHGGTPGGCT